MLQGPRLGLAVGALSALLAIAVFTSAGRAQTSPETVAGAVVRLTAEIPADARTANALGTRREGNGVVIDGNGLILTIGYLILEAMSVTVFDADGASVVADIVAYDYDTGFGLVRAQRPLGVKPLPLGDSDQLAVRDPILVVGHGGRGATVGALVVSRREFAGYWEYLLDDAIFTFPPHPNWGGAALVNLEGELVGIGSLYVQDAARGEQTLPGNMFVPINLLKPVFGDLLAEGRARGVPRPWVGMFTTEAFGRVVVTAVAPDGPASRAGVEPGDVIVAVDAHKVASMADMYRRIWALGAAGVEVPLRLLRDGEESVVRVMSANRYNYLKLNPTY